MNLNQNSKKDLYSNSKSNSGKSGKGYEGRTATTSYRRRERLKAENARLEKDRSRISRVFFLFIALGLVISLPFLRKNGPLSPGKQNPAKTEQAATVQDPKQSEETKAPTSKADQASNYNIMLDTTMGPMLYYNQRDPNWASYLWGGSDDLATYGCGPTCMAMLVNAFGNAGQYTPITMAEWEEKNGQFAKGNGSFHSIVNTTMQSFGFTVRSMRSEMTEDAIKNELQQGHLIIALVGKGYFTSDGHFLILRSINEDGTINIADPKSLENTQKPFTADFLLHEIHQGKNLYGAPLWSISK
ncbi:C39 family peptidase [Lachnospiraceae bacterium YH-ros2226]